MTPDEADAFQKDLRLVTTAIERAFTTPEGRPKMNVGMLGNAVRHAHYHIVPRYGTDPCPTSTPWNVPKEIRNAPEWLATPEQVGETKAKILAALKDVGAEVLSSYMS